MVKTEAENGSDGRCNKISEIVNILLIQISSDVTNEEKSKEESLGFIDKTHRILVEL